jgi:muramidase (phage lysozyme)
MNRAIPAGAAILLASIREIETGKADRSAYDVIYGHKQGKLPKPLTSMTYGEIIDTQKSWSKNHGSSAAGAYQFMRATLIDLAKSNPSISGSDKFTPQIQDQLGYQLLLRRGYSEFMAGKISRTEFGKRLAQEWASFPVLAGVKGAHRQVARGETYYAGDKLNKALVTPERIERLLDQVKAAGAQLVPSPVAPVPSPHPETAEEGAPEPVGKSKRFWTWLTTGGGTAVLPFVDWRVQFLIVLVVVGFAIYAIATMPGVRKKLGLA